MVDKKIDRFPSTFTIDNFSSTATLTPNNIKLPIGWKAVSDQKQYDPYEHRTLEHPNTFSGALIHILKSSMGTGILAIPMAFKYAGLIVGFIGTMLVGLLCTHTIHILVLASQKMCIVEKRPSMGFSETAHAVFKYGPKQVRQLATFARWFVDIGLILTYFFGDAVYVVFIGDSLQQIMHFYFPEVELDSRIYMLALMVFLLFTCQIRPLKYLVPFSAIANISMMICFGITFYYMIEKVADNDIGESSLSKGINGLPKFMVTVIFAMEGIGTILPVENSMVKPNFIGCPGVLNIAMIIIVILFGSIGFFGYFVYGEDTQPSVTYNLSETENLAMVARGCISLAVSLTFMLQFYVPMEISWRYMQPNIPPKNHNIVQIVWRIIAVVLITSIAILVPDLGTIIDIVGAVFLATLGLLVPATLDIVVNWEAGLGRFHWKLYKNLLVIFISIFASVSGIYFAISGILSG